MYLQLAQLLKQALHPTVKNRKREQPSEAPHRRYCSKNHFMQSQSEAKKFKRLKNSVLEKSETVWGFVLLHGLFIFTLLKKLKWPGWPADISPTEALRYLKQQRNNCKLMHKFFRTYVHK